MANVMPEPNTGCWLGLWKTTHLGYCQSKKRTVDGYLLRGAHRISYYLHFGVFDYSLNVCHKCDVPCCVNPEHLFLGTMTENMLDKQRKGRSVRGQDCHTSKISPNDVIKITELRRLGFSSIKLSRLFGIHKTSVMDILKGRSWAHITGLIKT